MSYLYMFTYTYVICMFMQYMSYFDTDKRKKWMRKMKNVMWIYKTIFIFTGFSMCRQRTLIFNVNNSGSYWVSDVISLAWEQEFWIFNSWAKSHHPFSSFFIFLKGLHFSIQGISDIFSQDKGKDFRIFRGKIFWSFRNVYIWKIWSFL